MPNKRKKISAEITLQSQTYLEQLISSMRATNLGEAIDLAVEEMRQATDRKRSERSEPHSPEPSPEEVAQDPHHARGARPQR